MNSKENFQFEVKHGKRFQFGKNWENFLNKINNERVLISETSISEMIGFSNLTGISFLDIGCGSGLSSLAAKNLGAKVTSFDFDESSVWCTNTLKKKFYKNDKNWIIKKGSVLDKNFLMKLGKHDIVYSWGVLHHTGKMWLAIDNSINLVSKNGLLFIAIYNDQGLKSHIWWLIKFIYNKLPSFLKKPYAYLLGSIINALVLFKYTIKLKPMLFLNRILDYKQSRGMNLLNDMIDWYGGFPYEFSSYEYLLEYIENKGFKLKNSKKATSLGCHQFVFKKL